MATVNTTSFMAALLAPVPGVADPEMARDCELGEEAADIAEAVAMIAKITAKRDAEPCGSHDRAVEQIALNWWQQYFTELTGLQMEGR